MKQLLLVMCAAVLVADADKRPGSALRSQFSFPQPQRFGQRQTAAGGEPEDLTPPSTSAPAGSTPDSSGPYPPSGQPASEGPYPPSGWKPQGQRLELPKKPSQQYGAPAAPQQQYGAPPAPAAPQQQYGAPPAPQQQYGTPSVPQQQYGAPQPQPSAPPAEVEPVEPTNETPEQAANTRLRQQVRQQRLLLQRLRQQLREQQQQLQQLRADSAPEPLHSQGALTQAQFSNSASAYNQEPLPLANQGQGSFVARLQFMDVPQVNAPIYSYTSPLIQV